MSEHSSAITHICQSARKAASKSSAWPKDHHCILLYLSARLPVPRCNFRPDLHSFLAKHTEGAAHFYGPRHATSLRLARAEPATICQIDRPSYSVERESRRSNCSLSRMHHHEWPRYPALQSLSSLRTAKHEDLPPEPTIHAWRCRDPNPRHLSAVSLEFVLETNALHPDTHRRGRV